MSSTQQPEALMQLADAYADASFDQGLHKRKLDDAPENARSVLAAAVRSQHARITKLEAQLSSSGFTATDMASVAAQGFRDGVASLAASAGSEPVASRAFLERALSAMEGVIDVADRQTDEFEALRSCVIDLTLMLFKERSQREARPCHVFTVRKVGPLTEWTPTTMAFALPDGEHALYTHPSPTSAEGVGHGL